MNDLEKKTVDGFARYLSFLGAGGRCLVSYEPAIDGKNPKPNRWMVSVYREGYLCEEAPTLMEAFERVTGALRKQANGRIAAAEKALREARDLASKLADD